MLSNRNQNDVTPVTTSQAQTQRFQLSGRYVLNDLNSQLQSQPRPQALVQNTRPQPQPVVNNRFSRKYSSKKKGVVRDAVAETFILGHKEDFFLKIQVVQFLLYSWKGKTPDKFFS
ncbi:hypothetical protein BpHYR1_043877 [Brachionus plicatilis]|uniref:Uncharacterized protein n=1 Tax=Brachionus plicatilis TaxID=10195 RepID=A0A3M7T7J7_BRAPC|nr:hypothetical protein BpHYR1_043877 [Brachionus plicatilis]